MHILIGPPDVSPQAMVCVPTNHLKELIPGRGDTAQGKRFSLDLTLIYFEGQRVNPLTLFYNGKRPQREN